jgi:hypothetical protein
VVKDAWKASEAAWIVALFERNYMQANVNTEFPKKQRGSALPPIKPEASSTYSINGAQVSVERGDARSYAEMRAAQLSALLHMTYGGGQEAFQTLNETLQDNLLWLASTLADELGHLIPLVADEARTKGGAQ